MIGEARAQFLWDYAKVLVTWVRPEHFEDIDSGSPLESVALRHYCRKHAANGVRFVQAEWDKRFA